MRLINTNTLEIHEYISEDKIPRYAILSHTWGDEEVKLEEIKDQSVDIKEGYGKIVGCCREAAKNKIDWAWVDTHVSLPD